MAYGRAFTDNERAFIAANAAKGAHWIAEALGITLKQAQNYYSRHGLKSGIDSRFKKGEQRGHRWQKGEHSSPATQFKKGNVPPQTAPEGDRSVRTQTDNRGLPVLMIRRSLDKWDFLHRYVWETFFGSIPAGHIVVFADGNNLNCHPDNLRLMNRRQNARRNHNAQKAATTIVEGRAKTGYYAAQVFRADKEMRQFVVDHAPDLVEAKRQEIRLKHQLKTQTNP